MRFIKKLKWEIVTFLVFVISRLPALGYDLFNTDVWRWKQRTYDFGSGIFNLDFVRTIQKYHPGVILMWIGTFAVKIYNLFYDLFLGHAPVDNDIKTVFELHTLQKILVVCVIGITLAFSIYVLRKLFGVKYSLIVALALILEPFYVALTRVVHLEGLMTTFMLASFLWFYYYLMDPRIKKRLILSGVFASFALLTKTSSLFLIPFMGLTLFMWYRMEKVSFGKAIRLSLKHYWKWLLVVILGFILFWPAMWVDPLTALETLYRGIVTIGIETSHEQYYFGRLVSDPGISFYLVVFALRSSIYLLVGLLGYFALAKKKFSTDVRRFILFTVLFALLYVVQQTIPSKKLDRYILPSLVALVLAAGFFYEWLINRFGKIVLLLLVPAFFILGYLHPDYLSYFNPLFGGLRVGVRVLEPKWIIGQHETISYLKTLKEEQGFEDFKDGDTVDNLRESVLEKKLVVGFQEKYYTQIWPFLNAFGARAVIQDLTPHAKKANYIIYPVWDDGASYDDRFKLNLVHVIKVRNVDLWRVYEIDRS